MLTLTIRTDKPEAEIGLFQDGQQLIYETWPAHRQLAETIHLKIKDLLSSQHKSVEDLNGIVVFQGPGSFTGLRIGISVGNALAEALNIPIVAAKRNGWLATGNSRIQKGGNDQLVAPEYGSPPHVTKPTR